MRSPGCMTVFALIMLMIAGGVNAQTRSGSAAYHYHSKEMITAARYEPVGSVLDVTNPHNGKTVRVRVAGRGPYNGNRLLDLSTGAFSQLYGGTGRGVGPMRYTVVSRGGGGRERREYNRGKHRGWSKRKYRSRRHRRSHKR